MPNVKLYRNTSDTNCYHKDIELLADIDCDFKSPINSTYESFKRRKLYLKINSSFFIFIFEYTRAKLSFKDDFE